MLKLVSHAYGLLRRDVRPAQVRVLLLRDEPPKRVDRALKVALTHLRRKR